MDRWCQELGHGCQELGHLAGEWPESGTLVVPDSGQSWLAQACSGLPRPAQDCAATSSGSLSHSSVLNLVCSGSKAEMDFGGISFGVRDCRL